MLYNGCCGLLAIEKQVVFDSGENYFKFFTNNMLCITCRFLIADGTEVVLRNPDMGIKGI